jgi:hypothetical protein
MVTAFGGDALSARPPAVPASHAALPVAGSDPEAEDEALARRLASVLANAASRPEEGGARRDETGVAADRGAALTPTATEGVSTADDADAVRPASPGRASIAIGDSSPGARPTVFARSKTSFGAASDDGAAAERGRGGD